MKFKVLISPICLWIIYCQGTVASSSNDLGNVTRNLRPVPIDLRNPDSRQYGSAGPGPAHLNLILKQNGTAYGTTISEVQKEQRRLLQEIQQAGIEYELLENPMTGLVNAIPMRIKDRKAINKLRRMNGVEKVLPIVEVTLTSKPVSGEDLPNRHLQALQRRDDRGASIRTMMLPHDVSGVSVAHKMGLSGKNIKVAIIDTGVDPSHPALGENCFGKPDCILAKFDDLVEPANTFPKDCGMGGHGTKVASILGGQREKVLGKHTQEPKGFVGVAPGVKLYVYRVYDCDTRGRSDWLSTAVERAVMRDKVDVINLSLGNADPWALGALGIAIDTVSKKYPKVHIVATAGNDGRRPFVVSGPGVASPILSVGAVDNRFVLSRVLLAGKTRIDYLYDVNFPINGTAIDRKPLLVVRPYGTSSIEPCKNATLIPEMLKGSGALQNLSTFTLMIYQDNCPDDYLELLATYGERAGAASIILVLSGNDLSSLSARGGMSTTAKWVKITKKDADHAILQRSPKQLTPGVWRSSISLRLLGSTDHVVRNANAGKLSAFSSYGPTATFDLKPQIVSFGGAIVAAKLGGDYVQADGTSYAAPYVSGSIALILEKMGNNGITAEDMRRLLMNTAVPAMQRMPTTRESADDDSIDEALDSGDDDSAALSGLISMPVQGQGAGVMNVHRALMSYVSNESLRPSALPLVPRGFSDKVELQMTEKGETSSFQYLKTIEIYPPKGNTGGIIFIARHIPACALDAETDSPTIHFAELKIDKATPRSVPNTYSLSVAPPKSRSLSVTIATSNSIPAGTLFSGFLQLSPSGGKGSHALYIPYSGIAGSLKEIPMYSAEKSKTLQLIRIETFASGASNEVPVPWNSDIPIPFTMSDPWSLLRVAFATRKPARQFSVFVIHHGKLTGKTASKENSDGSAPEEEEDQLEPIDLGNGTYLMGHLYRGEYVSALTSSAFWSTDSYPVQRFHPEYNSDVPVALPIPGKYQIILASWWGSQPLANDVELLHKGKLFAGPMLQFS
jgi:subtilisin family serine protease